jgi:hypothetical protein
LLPVGRLSLVAGAFPAYCCRVVAVPGDQVRFSEFWPDYLRHHSRSGTRAAHYLATGIGVIGLAMAISPVAPWWAFLAGIAVSYLMAFSSHWFIEHNQPVVMRGAHLMFFGALADLRMCALALGGGIEREYRRLGLRPPARTRQLVKRATGI